VIVVADNDTRKVLGLVIPDQTKRWATDAGGPFYPSLSVMLADDPKRWATDAGGPFYPSLSVMLADDPWFVVRR